MKLVTSFSLGLMSTALLAAPALADGFMLPSLRDEPIASRVELPNFTVRKHQVQVKIQNQVAKTQVHQIFYNPSRRDLEGTYLFPVPEGASVSAFEMDVNGQMAPAELLKAHNARRIYEEIVRRRIDPGLLEYAGRNLYRARVYPIPARGEKPMRLSYEQVIPAQEQLHHYRYGLSTEKFSQQPLQQASITVDIHSQQPLKNIYSPTHDISIQRLSETHARVSWEANQVKPDQDFDLYYSTSPDPVGATLLTYNPPGEDGYFMLLASPKVNWESEKTPAKNMTFVVDTSGSMSGKKIEQARQALVYNLQQLEQRDRFQLLSFSDAVRPFTPQAQRARPAEVSRAVSHARKLRATGGTDINSALLEALKGQQGAGVPMILFLTDGDPTVGETNFNQILKNVRAANGQGVRTFVFGVGFDVNIPFLEKLARENKGAAEFVRPEENIEVKVSRLFNQISHPILSDLKLSYGSVGTHDVMPRQLPDFFKGSQLMVVGRYSGQGRQRLRLSGQMNGKSHSFDFPHQDFVSGRSDYDFLPRLWATRKIGFLLDQIRLQGQQKELVEEVVRLSKRYGIITEYTSFLVRDDVDVRSEDPSPAMVREAEEYFNDSLQNEKGSHAISQSRNAANLQKKAAPGKSYLDAEGKEQQITRVKYVAQRAFYQKNGVWQDSLPAEKLPVIQVKRYSPLYFELAQNKALAGILALGDRVEFVHQKHLIKVDKSGLERADAALRSKLGL